MDTSSTYVEMCQKATEIQERRFESGDFFAEGMSVRAFEQWGYSEGAIDFEAAGGDIVWLPRQDQLQEMAFPDKSTSVRQMLDEFRYFVETTHLICASMEQLWLAFVMKQKYHKTWNGEGWVAS